MVECCNEFCRGSWFHLECVDPPIAKVPRGDWYCSEECRQSPAYIHCICKKKKGAEDSHLLRCKLKSSCRRREYYHRSCVNAGPVNEGIWITWENICSGKSQLQIFTFADIVAVERYLTETCFFNVALYLCMQGIGTAVRNVCLEKRMTIVSSSTAVLFSGTA